MEVFFFNKLGNQPQRHVKCFNMLVEMHASLNGLKAQDFAGGPKSEFVAQNLETFVKVYVM